MIMLNIIKKELEVSKDISFALAKLYVDQIKTHMEKLDNHATLFFDIFIIGGMLLPVLDKYDEYQAKAFFEIIEKNYMDYKYDDDQKKDDNQ